MSKNTLVNVVLLVISIGLAVAGQLVMKAGMKAVVEKGGDLTMKDFARPVALAGRILRDGPLAILGIVLYAFSAIFWLVVLSRVDLSVAYPIVAAGYVVVVLYSWLVFKEDVRWFTWIGLALIVIGVIMTAQGLKSSETKSPGIRDGGKHYVSERLERIEDFDLIIASEPGEKDSDGTGKRDRR